MTPGGCLTVVQGQARPVSGYTETVGTIHYSADRDNRIWLPDGFGGFDEKTFSADTSMNGLSYTGGTKMTAGNARHLWVFEADEELFLGADQTVWPSAAPSEAAGNITRLRGLPINTTSMICDTGPYTEDQVSVPAGRAIWVGSMRPSVQGQLTAHGPLSYGPARKFEFWNTFNRKARRLMVGYWPPSGEGVGGNNYLQFTLPNTNPNYIEFSTGVNGITPRECRGYVLTGAPEAVHSAYDQGVYLAGTSSALLGYGFAVGWNSVTQPSGRTFSSIWDEPTFHSENGTARYVAPDAHGISYAAMLYRGYYPSSAGSMTVQGGFNRAGDPPELTHLLTMEWEG